MEEKADKDDDKDEADAQKEYDRSDDDDDDDEEYEVTQWTQYDYLDKDSGKICIYALNNEIWSINLVFYLANENE